MHACRSTLEDPTYVLEGSARETGDQVRVHARLVSVHDGSSAWSRRYELPRSQLTGLHEQIANEIVALMRFGPPVAKLAGLTSEHAKKCYAEARMLCHRYGRDELSRALQLFGEAHAIEAEDPAVMAGFVMAIVRDWTLGMPPSDDAVELARSLAEGAIARAPERGESHVAMGAFHFQQGDSVSSVRSLRQAIACSPSLVEAHEMLGSLLIEATHVDEGRRRHEAALALEPSLKLPHWEALRIAMYDGDAVAENKLIAKLSLTNSGPSVRWWMESRGAIKRRDRRAMRRIASQIRAIGLLDDPFTALAAHGCALYLGEETAEPYLGLLDQLIGTSSNGGRRSIFYLQERADVLCYLGQPRAALDSVARAVQAGMADLMWMDRSQELAPARLLAGFAPLRQRVADRAMRVLGAFYGDDTGRTGTSQLVARVEPNAQPPRAR